jgi:hypothetical protein
MNGGEKPTNDFVISFDPKESPELEMLHEKLSQPGEIVQKDCCPPKKSPPREFDFKAKDQQIGGNHYKMMKIQPFHYAMANNFNAGQFGVLKYISRYKLKNGIEDLRKAKHFIELLAEEEYPNEKL